MTPSDRSTQACCAETPAALKNDAKAVRSAAAAPRVAEGGEVSAVEEARAA